VGQRSSNFDGSLVLGPPVDHSDDVITVADDSPTELIGSEASEDCSKARWCCIQPDTGDVCATVGTVEDPPPDPTLCSHRIYEAGTRFLRLPAVGDPLVKVLSLSGDADIAVQWFR